MTLAISSLLTRVGRKAAPAKAAAGHALYDTVLAELRDRRRPEQVARVVSNRIYALEQAGQPVASLADVARRELAFGARPFAAWTDSLALASVAAQRALGLRPHLAQLTAAIHAWCGDAAEMAPGEGKTLALALAAAVHALAGSTVHVVHREDAAAVRGIGRVRRLYQELGIQVRVLTAASQPADRRRAYAASVCYVSSRELLFDALEDAEALGFSPPERICALVDDVDQVLVDGGASTYRLTREDLIGAGPERAAAAGDPAISPQGLFRRYRLLGGVSGTLAEAATELQTVYRMNTARIASIYPDFRRDLGTTVVRGARQLDATLLARVRGHLEARRPVLVLCGQRHGLLEHARRLADAGHETMVLNDPLSRSEALALAASAAVSPFGFEEPMRTVARPGALMLCTEEDAWSLDLGLEPGARATGGVAVIVIGLGADARADRRLRQIAARQGHPGSVEFLVDATAPYRSTLPIRSAADRLSALPLPVWLASPLILGRRRRHEHGVMRARLRLARRSTPLQESPLWPAPAHPMLDTPLTAQAAFRTH